MIISLVFKSQKEKFRKKSLKFEENERNLTSFSGHVLLPSGSDTL